MNVLAMLRKLLHTRFMLLPVAVHVLAVQPRVHAEPKQGRQGEQDEGAGGEQHDLLEDSGDVIVVVEHAVQGEDAARCRGRAVLHVE